MARLIKNGSIARVFLVDDHPVVRLGLKKYINNEENMTVCGESEDANTAIRGINDLDPDIVIVDLSLGSVSGFDLIQAINARYSNLPVIVYSMHDDIMYVERAIKAGARGYISKNESMDTVITGINTVLQGNIFLADYMKDNLISILSGSNRISNMQNDNPLNPLSNRELEIFEYIGKGMGTQQIAKKMNLNVKTIDTYKRRIKEKLNLNNSIELIQYSTRYYADQ